jgi:hypothetical protein
MRCDGQQGRAAAQLAHVARCPLAANVAGSVAAWCLQMTLHLQHAVTDTKRAAI